MEEDAAMVARHVLHISGIVPPTPNNCDRGREIEFADSHAGLRV